MGRCMDGKWAKSLRGRMATPTRAKAANVIFLIQIYILLLFFLLLRRPRSATLHWSGPKILVTLEHYAASAFYMCTLMFLSSSNCQT